MKNIFIADEHGRMDTKFSNFILHQTLIKFSADNVQDPNNKKATVHVGLLEEDSQITGNNLELAVEH